MPGRTWFSALIVCVLALSGSLPAVAANAALPVDMLQQYLDDAVASGAPGIVLAVSDHGDQWAGVAGYSSIEHRQELRIEDSFPVFSVTKTFTAVAALQLVEEGALSLDDRLGELLPATNQPAAYDQIPYVRQITIRELLNHTSGIYDYGNSMEYLLATVGNGADFSREWQDEDIFSYAHADRNAPAGEPGSVVSYSSTGYRLLDLVIEAIENKPLAKVLEERIVVPLGLSSTYLPSYENWRAADVTGYIKVNDEMRQMGIAGDFPAARNDLVNATQGLRSRQGMNRGEDGAVSTAASLMKFATALFEGRLLSDAMLDEMLSADWDQSVQNGRQFGLGVHLVTDGTRRWALMFGNGAGGEALVGRELNSGLTFVALTNVFGAGVTDRMLESIQSLARDSIGSDTAAGASTIDKQQAWHDF